MVYTLGTGWHGNNINIFNTLSAVCHQSCYQQFPAAASMCSQRKSKKVTIQESHPPSISGQQARGCGSIPPAGENSQQQTSSMGEKVPEDQNPITTPEEKIQPIPPMTAWEWSEASNPRREALQPPTHPPRQMLFPTLGSIPTSHTGPAHPSLKPARSL